MPTDNLLWKEAEKAAARFYRDSGAPHRAIKEYAYAMGYYHALKKPVILHHGKRDPKS